MRCRPGDTPVIRGYGGVVDLEGDAAGDISASTTLARLLSAVSPDDRERLVDEIHIIVKMERARVWKRAADAMALAEGLETLRALENQFRAYGEADVAVLGVLGR